MNSTALLGSRQHRHSRRNRSHPGHERRCQSDYEKHQAIHISVAGGGSGVGVQKVGEGLVDIGNAGRPVSDKEKDKYPKLKSFAFAVDGVAPAVHPSNPVTNLSNNQIRDIFSGKITNWKASAVLMRKFTCTVAMKPAEPALCSGKKP